MSRGDRMLEALRTQRMRPGTSIEFVDRIASDPRRLVVEFYPKGPYYRISYRTYGANHNSISGQRNVGVTWEVYFVFDAKHTYGTASVTLPSHTPPSALNNTQLKALQAAVRGDSTKLAKNGFYQASEQRVETLWSDLKLWTRL